MISKAVAFILTLVGLVPGKKLIMALLMVWSLFHLRPHTPFLSTQKFMYVKERNIYVD